tara:strand:+ start:1007 stop:1405 length:399 start_codon:yes stop_codon:yes gene_type:complete
MFPKLLTLFICLPLVEILILIKLGEVFGFWYTVFLVIGTGILGATLARAQGFWVWMEIQQDLQKGNMPADKMIDGLMIFVGGIVLLTPGLLSDIFGFAMLVPLTRNIFKRWIKNKLEEMHQSGNSKITFFIK